MQTCPKCRYTRTASDTAPSYECPKCGIVYAKFDPESEIRREKLRASTIRPPQTPQTPQPPSPPQSPQPLETKTIETTQITPAKETPVDKWGFATRLFCVAGGLFALFGGLNLLFLKAAGENSLMEAIAHGIGWYFVGKGIFMMTVPFHLQSAIHWLVKRRT